MKKTISWIAAVFLVFVCLFLLSFIPPFHLLFLPIRIMLEPKPEALAKQGVPIAQAVVDYQRDHGLFPETIADLIPTYLAKEPPKEWTIQFNGADTTLVRRGGQPHSYIRFWFSGPQAGQWRYYPDSADKNRQIDIPSPSINKAQLTGETLFAAKLAAFEHRINQHPHELWYYEDKICFLGLSNRTELLLADCERAAKEFPEWWLPRFTLALHSPTNSDAQPKFETWVRAHGSHVSYWLLAHYYREIGDTAAALRALKELIEQPFVKYPNISRWDSGARFLFDACKFAYEKREFGLCLELAGYWKSGRATYEENNRLAFEAAAELASGDFDSAIEHARRLVSIAKKDGDLTTDIETMLRAAEAHDTNYIYRPGDPEPRWALFREPTP